MGVFASTYWRKFLGTACISVSLLWISPVQADITPDSTLSNNSNVKLQVNTTLIEAGTRAGNNLFHSFKEFSVPTGAEAHFNNSVDINNILTRVTGGSISNIDGLIKANGTANLFLINPAGIVFGENARLDIGGSFVGSTADAIGFNEDNFFSASNPQSDSSLLQVNPNALFFNQIQPASIENNSVADVGLNPSGNYPGRGLQVPDGKSLLLVGGNLSMDGGGLVASGGRVELGGLATAGTVGLNVDGNNLSLNFPVGIERSDITFSNDAGVRVAADGGGSIAVNARNLEMTGDSFLFAGINEGSGSEQSKAGNIDINATGAINLSESEIANQVQESATGEGGDINISANKLQVENGSLVLAVTRGNGDGGNLNVDAQDIQLITGSGSRTGLFALAARESTGGNAGNLTIKTNTLLILDGAQVNAGTSAAGNAGNLTIEAQDIQVVGVNKDGRGSRLVAQGEGNSTGDAGNLTIKTNTLLVLNGGKVGAGAFSKGGGGNLTIDAQDVQVIGANVDKDGRVNASTVDIIAEKDSDPQKGTGDLIIRTNTLLVKGGALINSSTTGEANSGNLTINAQVIEVTGGIPEGDRIRSSTVTTSAKEGSTGDAGTLTINARELKVLDEGQVTAKGSAGQGGDVNINTSILQVENGVVTVRSDDEEGSAGNLVINADSIRLNNDAKVTASTFSNQVALGKEEQATITIKSKDLIMRRGSTIETNADGTNIVGGNININADIIAAFENSDISANSDDSRGGNILIETQGIFGTQFRLQPTDFSDITATGASEDLSGNVEIINPDIDPNTGLVNLPSIPVEAEVAQGCTAGSSIAQSRFEIIGRGGLPHLPNDALSADAVEVDLVMLKPEINKPLNTNVSTKPLTSTPKKIVEATGWVRNKKGEIFFVADASNGKQLENWYKNNHCRG